MTDKPEALRLADLIDPNGVCLNNWRDLQDAAAELRRLHEANEKFGKRQEWWNERMFALEKQRDAAELMSLALKAQKDELLEALRGYVNDYSSEDGMYTEKHYVKVFSEVIARAEEKQ